MFGFCVCAATGVPMAAAATRRTNRPSHLLAMFMIRKLQLQSSDGRLDRHLGPMCGAPNGSRFGREGERWGNSTHNSFEVSIMAEDQSAVYAVSAPRIATVSRADD